MNKSELVSAVANESEHPKTVAGEILDALFIVIEDELKDGGEVHMTGIGKLSVKTRSARTARNPRTGAAVKVPARNVPKFTPAKQLKDVLLGTKAKAKAAPAKSAAKAPAKTASKAAPAKRPAAAPAKAATASRTPVKAPAAKPQAAAPARRRAIR